ncbi:MAG: hypothetical protein ACKOB1_02650 [Planctomycetia bacterium]
MRPAARVPCWAAILILLAAGRAVAVDMTVGIGGVHRTGDWTPIVVVPGGEAPAGAEWRVWVEDADGQWVRSPGAVPVDGADGKTLRFRARFGRPAGGVQVEGPDAAGRAQRRFVAIPPALAAGEATLLVIGDLDAAERASRLTAREDGRRPRVIRAARPRDLAAGAAGMTARDFDGIDMAVVCGTALDGDDDDLSRDVLAALDGWLMGGGKLVFIAGASAARVAASGRVPAEWLPGPPGEPGRVERLVPLRRFAAVETFGRAARPLDRAALAGLEAPLLADAARLDGTVLAFEGRAAADLPLVVRRIRGFGTVTWLGVDIDGPSFRSWPGTDTLLVELLGSRAAGAEGGRAGESGGGMPDLAGQLRTAIDRFPGVAAVPFEVIAALGLLYIACLYPLDWWLAGRGGRRAVMAWLTLPLFVALFSGLAWGAGRRWKGDAWQSTAAGLVDIDCVTGLVRGSAWSGTWSPANAVLDVAASSADALPSAAADVAVSWHAAAGRGLGATDAPAPHPALGAADYAYAATLGALTGAPIAADSSRLFEAGWTARLADPGAGSPIVSTLDRDAQAALRGAIESRLPFALEGTVLVHAGWLYDVGRLAPGARFEPEAGRGPRSLAGALTRRAAAKDRDVAERWDTSSTDVGRILEIAGFHRAAGGRAYTSLEPGRLGRLDLSPVLDTGRAVLVGRGPAGTAWRVQAGGAAPLPPVPSAEQTAVWRFVLPLEPRQP